MEFGGIVSIPPLFSSRRIFKHECTACAAACYRPWGAYIQGGFLIKGNFFNYDEWDALPLTPKESKSLLLSGRINVTNLNDGPVKGGMQQDITVGLNYYMNKFLILKLNGSVVWTKDMEEVKSLWRVTGTLASTFLIFLSGKYSKPCERENVKETYQIINSKDRRDTCPNQQSQPWK